MFALGNLLSAIAQILDIILTILWWMILIRALLSWVNPDPFNPIVIFLNRATEPILAPFRKLICAHTIGMDLSPLVAILAILFIRLFLVKTLFDIAARMG